jgi:hypothetical protein
MSMFKHIAIASVLVAGLGFAATANAEEARLSDCIQMAKQVSTAMEAAQPSQTTDQARNLARNARMYCTSNMYERGVALYSKALTLLGNKG